MFLFFPHFLILPSFHLTPSHIIPLPSSHQLSHLINSFLFILSNLSTFFSLHSHLLILHSSIHLFINPFIHASITFSSFFLPSKLSSLLSELFFTENSLQTSTSPSKTSTIYPHHHLLLTPPSSPPTHSTIISSYSFHHHLLLLIPPSSPPIHSTTTSTTTTTTTTTIFYLFLHHHVCLFLLLTSLFLQLFLHPLSTPSFFSQHFFLSSIFILIHSISLHLLSVSFEIFLRLLFCLFLFLFLPPFSLSLLYPPSLRPFFKLHPTFPSHPLPSRLTHYLPISPTTFPSHPLPSRLTHYLPVSPTTFPSHPLPSHLTHYLPVSPTTFPPTSLHHLPSPTPLITLFPPFLTTSFPPSLHNLFLQHSINNSQAHNHTNPRTHTSFCRRKRVFTGVRRSTPALKCSRTFFQFFFFKFLNYLLEYFCNF